jgi:hypothetical protein
MDIEYRIIALWGSPQRRGGGFAEAPRDVITIDWKIIYIRFLEKFRG